MAELTFSTCLALVATEKYQKSLDMAFARFFFKTDICTVAFDSELVEITQAVAGSLRNGVGISVRMSNKYSVHFKYP